MQPKQQRNIEVELCILILFIKHATYYRKIILPKEFRFQSAAHKWFGRSYDWPLLCIDEGLSERELKRVTLRAGMSWKRRETTVPKRPFRAAVSITHITNTHHTTTLTLPQPACTTHTHDITAVLTHTSNYTEKNKGTHNLTKLQTVVTKLFEWSQRKKINFCA